MTPILFTVGGHHASIDFKAVEFVVAEPRVAVLCVLAALGLVVRWKKRAVPWQ